MLRTRVSSTRWVPRCEHVVSTRCEGAAGRGPVLSKQVSTQVSNAGRRCHTGRKRPRPRCCGRVLPRTPPTLHSDMAPSRIAPCPGLFSPQVRERGKKVLANIIAQQEGLITRPHFKAFVRKLGTQAVPNTRPERPPPRHCAARPVGQGWPHLRPHLDATPVGQGWPHLDAACNTTPCPFSRGWILALSAQRHSCPSRPCPRRRRGGL